MSYDPGRPVIKGNENTIQAGQERLSAGGLMARPVGFEPTTYGLEVRRLYAFKALNNHLKINKFLYKHDNN